MSTLLATREVVLGLVFVFGATACFGVQTEKRIPGRDSGGMAVPHQPKGGGSIENEDTLFNLLSASAVLSAHPYTAYRSDEVSSGAKRRNGALRRDPNDAIDGPLIRASINNFLEEAAATGCQPPPSFS